jgi:hypothetical protein
MADEMKRLAEGLEQVRRQLLVIDGNY